MLGHGLFTYAVIEGLGGKGELGTKQQISTKELADYVVKRVEQLAKVLNGEQEPQYFKGRDAEDYVLARWAVGDTGGERPEAAPVVTSSTTAPTPALPALPKRPKKPAQAPDWRTQVFR